MPDVNHPVFDFALEEAVRLGHPYVGVEHLLLGLLKAGDRDVIRFLETSNVSPDEVAKTLEAHLPPAGSLACGRARQDLNAPNVSSEFRYPLTSRAKKVVDLFQKAVAAQETAPRGIDLLRAIVEQRSNIAAQVLYELGVGTGNQGSE